jgi:hypothetical protein
MEWKKVYCTIENFTLFKDLSVGRARIWLKLSGKKIKNSFCGPRCLYVTEILWHFWPSRFPCLFTSSNHSNHNTITAAEHSVTPDNRIWFSCHVISYHMCWPHSKVLHPHCWTLMLMMLIGGNLEAGILSQPTGNFLRVYVNRGLLC